MRVLALLLFFAFLLEVSTLALYNKPAKVGPTTVPQPFFHKHIEVIGHSDWFTWTRKVTPIAGAVISFGKIVGAPGGDCMKVMGMIVLGLLIMDAIKGATLNKLAKEGLHDVGNKLPTIGKEGGRGAGREAAAIIGVFYLFGMVLKKFIGDSKENKEST